MNKHNLNATHLARYGGWPQRKVRRMLSSALTMDIDELDWLVQCVAELTKTEMTLPLLLKELEDEDNKRAKASKANH